MNKIVTKDGRYVILIEEESQYNEYYIFETFDSIVSQYIGEDALEFYQIMQDRRKKPSIEFVVKSDGFSNMDGCADNTFITFRDKTEIDSFYGMISTCYKDAQNRFKF